MHFGSLLPKRKAATVLPSRPAPPLVDTCCPPHFYLFFFVLSYLLLHDEIFVPSLFIITPVPKDAQRSRFGLTTTRTLLTCFVLFFLSFLFLNFWTSVGGTCCCNLYTYHNASLIADQCISMFRRGGKLQWRDFKNEDDSFFPSLYLFPCVRCCRKNAVFKTKQVELLTAPICAAQQTCTL